MQARANRLPTLETAEPGETCPYCGRDRYVLVVRDAGDWTVCIICLAYALDLPMEWSLSRVIEHNLSVRDSARSLPPKTRR